MSRFYLLLASPFCAVLLASCAVPPRQFPPVTPGQLFRCADINVRAPNSDGWQLARSSIENMGFGKHGRSAGETFGAQLSMFDLEPTESPEQLVLLFEREFKENTDPKRFTIVESSNDYTNERGYPCVRHYALGNDRKAKTSAWTREELILEIHALYCRHPVRTNTGFAVVYSHRGRTRYQNLATDAQDFMKGVQVPRP